VEKGNRVMTNWFSRSGVILFGQSLCAGKYQETRRQSGIRRSRALYHTLLALVLVMALLASASCSSNSTKTNNSVTPIIAITMTQTPPSSLNVGGTAQVSASVSNDAANAGVDWVALCGSAPKCGSFSPAHTASGSPTTFTAPFGVPSGNSVQVTALSTTDHSKAASSSVTIISTVSGITITQPPPATAAQLSIVTMSATVTGDPANLGVDWTFSCGGVSCTPAGGLHSGSGAPALFQVPGPAQFPTLVGSTIIATARATADYNYSAIATFIVTAGISITLTQAPPASMPINGTAPVIATVANDTTNAGVDWTVSCDNPPNCGTVTPAHTASGQTATFTAPPTPPIVNPQNPTPSVTITATATAGGIGVVTATASVNIVAPITVQITQSVPNNSLVVSTSAPLIATVANDSANAGVDWTVTCGSSGACGSFSPAHTASGAATTFTAPSAVPTGGTVTITAASTTDPTQTATETVTITASVPLLLGQYVILVSARNSVNGPYTFGGVISADGNGNITSGNVDLVDSTGNAAPAASIGVAGTYTITSSGSGQIQLTINTAGLSGGSGSGTFGVNGTGAVTLSVVFATPQHALLSETDSFGSGTGTLDLQNASDLSSFVSGTTGLSGTYSLKLTGVEASSPYPGYFLAGAIALQSTPSSYGVTAYVVDQSAGGAITSVPFTSSSHFGQATLSSNGGLAMSSVPLGLTTQFNLDAWLIDANHFVVTDWRDSFAGSPPVLIGGYLTVQPSSPAVSGTYAFTEAGATSSAQTQVAGGILTCGSSGTLDVTPLAGTALSNQTVSATCTAPANGRGLIAISGGSTGGISQFAAYPTLDQGLYLIELDGGSAGTSGPSGAGVAFQQTLTAPISASSLSGNYASNYSASTSTGTENFAGQIISDGVSVLSGTADVNSFNATAAPPVGTPSPGASLSGSFTAASNGRFPLALTITPATGQPTPPISSINPACYVVDANSCLLLGLDTTAPGTGILLLQSGL
jgi:hypothetical protein